MTFCNTVVRVCTVSSFECTKNCKGGKCKSATFNDTGMIRAADHTHTLTALPTTVKVLPKASELSHFEVWMKDSYTAQLFQTLNGINDVYVPKIVHLDKPLLKLPADQFTKLLEDSSALGVKLQAQIDKDFCSGAALSPKEQAAVLSDLTGIEVLINHHEVEALKADAADMHEHFLAHNTRIEDLRGLGQQLIANAPELWVEAHLPSTTDAYTGV